MARKSIWVALVAAAATSAASAQVTTVVETQKTMAGQPLVAPPGPMEVVATTIVMRAGQNIDMHMHFWPRYVYVQSGQVEVTLLDSGPPKRFNAGSMIVEPIGKWHSGRIIQDAVLVAVEQVPPGRCNTVKPPVPGKTNDC
ncbi:MAG TPA: cupin domain-containing protein [Allosphingosinicella sp.]|nr:cupin domain-containing protein [Allosphingosinicella sp.]